MREGRRAERRGEQIRGHDQKAIERRGEELSSQGQRRGVRRIGGVTQIMKRTRSLEVEERCVGVHSPQLL